MIITEYVEIRTNVGNSNLDFYKSIGYDISINPLKIKVTDLSNGSNCKIKVKCDYCDNIVDITYKAYNKTQGLINKYACSRKCSSIKTKEINLIKYGVESTSQLDLVKEKNKSTNLIKYGVDNPMKVNYIKEKQENKMLDLYGDKKALNISAFRDKKNKTSLDKYGVINYTNTDKSKITNLIKYGVDNPMKVNYIKEKQENKIFDLYGVNNIMKCSKFRNKFIISNDVNYILYLENEFSLFNCSKGHKYEIKSKNYFDRLKLNIPLCTICNPIGEQKSIKEKDLLEFIQSNYSSEIIPGYRDGLEIDIYLPELKLGFEFNGLYWHSEKYKEKNYHINKTNYFKEKGIRIIHIWEDDWSFNKDIVKSQILNFIGQSKKIYARKCQVKLVDTKEVRNFLDSNHIQGFVSSKIKLGLYFEDNLVSLMTFDQFEGRNKMEEGGYNLNRFCNLLGYNIVGGASKLLSYFENTYNPIRIISYADKDWSIGRLYEILGFRIMTENGPDYKYIVDDRRLHKSRYKKSITGLSESKLNLNRIWDSGKIKFEKIIIKNEY